MDLDETLLLLLLATWLAGGVAVALLMGRSGHDFRLWLALGALLGPFAGLFAYERHRLDTRRRKRPSIEFHPGPFDAVAGIDGSEESVAAVETALRLFVDSLSSITLVTVLDYESGGSFTGIARQSEAYSRLAEVASNLEFEPIELKLVYGSPGAAIAELAAEGGFELVVVGARGNDMSQALMGSVTERLIGNAPVPVFVGPHTHTGAPVRSASTGQPNERQ